MFTVTVGNHSCNMQSLRQKVSSQKLDHDKTNTNATAGLDKERQKWQM